MSITSRTGRDYHWIPVRGHKGQYNVKPTDTGWGGKPIGRVYQCGKFWRAFLFTDPANTESSFETRRAATVYLANMWDSLEDRR